MSKKPKLAPTPIAALQAQFQQASTLHQQGMLQQAEMLYQGILQANPKHVDALHFLGILLAQTGRAQGAVELMQQAIAINPHQHALFSNLGNALATLARFEEATVAYRKALALRPQFEQALFNLGTSYRALGQHAQAIDALRKALAIQPQLLEAHLHLGYAFTATHQHAAAIEHFQQLTARQPAHAAAWLGMAVCLRALQQHRQALAAVAQCLALEPNHVDALDQQGQLLHDLGDFHASRNSFIQALQVAPHRADIQNRLGVAYYEQGDLPQAIAHYRLAIAADPQLFIAHTNLLFSLSISPACSPQTYLDQVAVYRQSLAQHIPTPFTQWPDTSRHGDGVLRIGFVSGDLNHHPVGFFLEGWLKHVASNNHAPALELLAYATSNKEDALTDRLKPSFKHWRPVHDMSAQQAAAQIHEDGVHLLIDLAGHTGDNMLEIFAWHPAPVQITWLGYFASAGVPHIDWILADALSLPPADEQHFFEKVVRLPHTRLCFTPPITAPAIAPLPALRNGHITFGCFQPLVKVQDDVLQLWARVMAALPDARLRLQSRTFLAPEQRSIFLARLQDAGIQAQRVSLCTPSGHEAYLQAYGEVDIILDTFPFPGGTTTCDALWMGAPTLTLAGQNMVSRQGAALMSAANLPDWVANDHDAFVALAVAKARDLQALANLRAHLRDHVGNSPLFDAPRFANDWLTTLQQLWADVSPSLNLQAP